MADLREKDDASKIYVVLFMLHFKREHCLESAILVDFEQKNGPKSRSSVGGFPYNFREIIIEIIKKNWRWPWKSMFSIKINIKSRRKRASTCSFRLQINENQEGNEHVFKIMFKKFKIFDGCYSEIFEFRGRAEGVFYPKMKKELKNSLIEARTSWEKNRNLLVHFPIRKTRLTCFDHNFSLSARIRSSFGSFVGARP